MRNIILAAILSGTATAAMAQSVRLPPDIEKIVFNCVSLTHNIAKTEQLTFGVAQGTVHLRKSGTSFKMLPPVEGSQKGDVSVLLLNESGKDRGAINIDADWLLYGGRLQLAIIHSKTDSDGYGCLASVEPGR